MKMYLVKKPKAQRQKTLVTWTYDGMFSWNFSRVSCLKGTPTNNHTVEALIGRADQYHSKYRNVCLLDLSKLTLWLVVYRRYFPKRTCLFLYGCESYLQCVSLFTAESHHLVDHVPVPCFNAIGRDQWFGTSRQTNSYKKAQREMWRFLFLVRAQNLQEALKSLQWG